MYDILELNKKLLPELKEIAKQLNVKKADVLRKQDLIYKILDQQAILATEGKKTGKQTGKLHISRIIKEEAADHGVLKTNRPELVTMPGPK